jgi:hypothetical protein
MIKHLLLHVELRQEQFMAVISCSLFGSSQCKHTYRHITSIDSNFPNKLFVQVLWLATILLFPFELKVEQLNHDNDIRCEQEAIKANNGGGIMHGAESLMK